MKLLRAIHLDPLPKGALLLLLILAGCTGGNPTALERMEIRHERFRSVRFDPSYYYDTGVKVKQLCAQLTREWEEAGINAVYFKAYDPAYGASYRTEYPLNVQTDYGRLDLLRVILDACHKRHISVFAWIPAFQHKHAWLKHPQWRVKDPDGEDYRPSTDSYFLCVRQPAFRAWWMGFVADLVERYPLLDGVDIAEPIVAWRTQEGCYCALCREALRREAGPAEGREAQQPGWIASVPLTSLLAETCSLVHAHDKKASITTVVTPHPDGRLLSAREQRALTGFDLEGVLDSPNRPDIINVELIWQQWADTFRDTITFTPGWTEQACRQMASQVKDRANLIVHVELTPFGNVAVDEQRFVASVRAALDAGARGLDFYDSHQATRLGLSPQAAQALTYIPTKQVVVYYDPDGENDARQLAVLLRHFRTQTVLAPLGERFSRPDRSEADVIFYLGVTSRGSLPEAFAGYLAHSERTVCWVNHNLQHFGGGNLGGLGLEYQELDEKSRYQIVYRETAFPKADSSLNIIRIRDGDRCRVLATAKSSQREVPYVVRSGSFWYVADLPSAYVAEGGRHIVFADLLHDMLGEDHQERHLALVRIEDVNPTSDPERLGSIADLLASRRIPFSVGVTPFYLEPATNTALSLSDRPEVAKALRRMVAKGGAIVLHGCTHQYRGQSTVDYEFWDGLTGQPIFQDSEKYVRDRIQKALDECLKNELYPVAWETPHYAASQLDYGVVDEFFSTSYERRQAMDALGTDQLLPFLIPARGNGPQIVPENLGYVPMSDPRPDHIVEGARRNLLVRDGFASFFFHPFVPLESLEELAESIQGLGYAFADIRTLNNSVVTPSQAVVTGKGTVRLDLNDQYLNEFCLTPRASVKDQRYSDHKLSARVDKEVVCDPGWTYVARAEDHRRPGLAAHLRALLSRPIVSLRGNRERSRLQAANPPAVPVILIDPKAEGDLRLDQESLSSAFESVGIDYQAIAVPDFLEIPEGCNLVVVPFAAARSLTQQQTLFIVRALAKGSNLILEKESGLSVSLGIVSTGQEKATSWVVDEYYPQVNIQWKKQGTYRDFEVPIEYVTYYSDKNTSDPLVIGGEYGEGKYLYFATMFDPTTSRGYGRYPYFCDLIQRQFDLWPVVRSECAEVYFEPGDREDVSIEDLVKQWKKSGFRRVYVAGWHVYAKWTYDYARLIELAHKNAMLVYLWLELPHVGEKFWDDHPHWRERTATGREAVVAWRRLMALTVAPCRQAAFYELSELIRKYDWDGVNLAELYFESPVGPACPDMFTPMHPSVRASFQTRHGFDPMDLFDSSSPSFWERNPARWAVFEEYRKDLLVELHREFLAFLHQERQRKGDDLEIVATVIDDIHSTSGRETATDTRRLIALGEELPFTLQIEDPGELWHLDPIRYRELSQTYHRMLSNQPLILDINIVPYRDLSQSAAPTLQQTGMELNQLLRYALHDSNRVALYSESSIYEVDLPWIACALGRNAKERFSSGEWEVESRSAVSIHLDPEQHKDILIDGALWPAYHKGKAVLPSGTHTVQAVGRKGRLARVFGSSTRLVDISGELESCRMLPQGVEVSYTSPTRNYLIVNEEPQKVLLDGKIRSGEVLRGIACFSLKLPAGSHSVRILTRGGGVLSLKGFSIVASGLIVLFSSVAGSVLLVLYVARFRRARKRSR